MGRAAIRKRRGLLGEGDVDTATDAVRVGVLGPLEVTNAAGRPVRVGGQRVRSLLILLALDAGRVVSARSLIERLWPDEGPADAVNALQSLMSRLRVAFRVGGVPDGALESSPAGYRLVISPDAVDALVFADRARAGSQALGRGDASAAARLLREALGAWRGPALTDVSDDEFACAPVARLAELRSAATLDRIDADLALGESGPALIGELRELTAADPLAERPAALLMRALASVGRQAEALAVYQRARDQLAERLGVDPSAQLEQAHLAVLRQEIRVRADDYRAAATPVSGARLAATGHPPTSFVGRDTDVADVLKKLATERLVTLTGPGGVGKTRLATEAAAQLAGPAWLAELARVTEPTEVPYAVLDALGLRERSIARRGSEGGADPADRLCAALAARDAILILDNCEHVIDAAAGLAARLLADCPGVRILATSREPLRIGGEILSVVAPLEVPPVAAPDPRVAASVFPRSYPAVLLFEDRAAAVLPGFAVDAANAESVARICRALDGMPLAIELAAAWLRVLTPAQLAGRLDDRFALLTGGSRTAQPRHRTLRAVVDWSWNLLSAPERVLARRLAVFPVGATLAAAEQVCADLTLKEKPPMTGQTFSAEPLPRADPLPHADPLTRAETLTRADVLPALSGLVGKSILAMAETPTGSAPRYRMLETVRAYGLEQLAEAGEEIALRNAFARYYLDLAEIADPLLRTADQIRWFGELIAEQDNVNAALRWAIARREADTALRFVRALGYYWVQCGHGEGDALAREVLALTPPEPPTRWTAEARVICAVIAAGWAFDIEAVKVPLVEAIAGLAAWGDDYVEFHPLVAIAEPLLLQFTGERERAQDWYERHAAARDPWLRAMGKLYRASHASELGRLDGAEEDLLVALGEFRVLGEKWGAALVLTTLADFTELRGDHAASIAALEEAVSLGRELSAWGDLCYVEARLAIIRARTGDLARARVDLVRACLSAAERSAKVNIDRWVTFMRAELDWLAADFAAVARCCSSVLTLIENDRAIWWESLRARVRARLALALLEQGDAGGCADLLAAALDAAAAWVEHPTLAVVLDACARYALHADDAELAARLLGAAHAVRGAFDESSPDAPRARRAASARLGLPAFDAAYGSAADLGYDTALAFAREALSALVVEVKSATP
jgi:predicted ATPase/DNA-binding SARP family transcriptional activator